MAPLHMCVMALTLISSARAQDVETAYAKIRGASPEVVIAALECGDIDTRELALAQIARENRSPELTRAAAAAVATVRPPGVRAQLIAVLAERGDASAAPAVRAALNDPDPTVRAAAAQACGRFKDAKATDDLFGMLDGAQDEVAREALRRIPDRAIDARLFKQVRKGKGAERVRALELLSARRAKDIFELALDGELFKAGDPALAKAAAGVIRAYAPAGSFERLLDFALALPAPSAELLAGTLSATLDEAADRAACERRLGTALSSGDPARAPMLTGLLAASQGPDALASLSKRLESDDLETRKDAIRNLGKWNSEAALVPLVLAAKREHDAGAQTLAWRAVLDIVKRADKITDFYQPVSAIQQVIWCAPRRDEKIAALQALPFYHPKAWEVEWLLTKIETELPEMAADAQSVKASLVPPFSGLLGR